MIKPISTALIFALALTLSLAVSASPLFKKLQTDTFTTLNDYRGHGRWLVVMIWASDCEICRLEAPSYQQFHQRHAGKDAVVVGITLDGAEREQHADGFVAQHGLQFDNLLGEPEAVVGYYEVITGTRWVGTPSFLIFAPDGELRARQAGAVEVEIVEQFIASSAQ